jgi:hypothetical protein
MLQSDPVKGRSQFGYLVNVPKAGSYEVKFNLDSRHKAQGTTAQFYVDQQPQGGVITMPRVTGGDSWPGGAVHHHLVGRHLADRAGSNQRRVRNQHHGGHGQELTVALRAPA